MPPSIIVPGQIRITVIYDVKTKTSRFESDQPVEAHLAIKIFTDLNSVLIANILKIVETVTDGSKGPQAPQPQNPFKA